MGYNILVSVTQALTSFPLIQLRGMGSAVTLQERTREQSGR